MALKCLLRSDKKLPSNLNWHLCLTRFIIHYPGITWQNNRLSAHCSQPGTASTSHLLSSTLTSTRLLTFWSSEEEEEERCRGISSGCDLGNSSGCRDMSDDSDNKEVWSERVSGVVQRMVSSCLGRGLALALRSLLPNCSLNSSNISSKVQRRKPTFSPFLPACQINNDLLKRFPN